MEVTEKTLISIDNSTNKVLIKQGEEILHLIVKEDYDVMCFKSRETDNFVCCVFKKVPIRTKKNGTPEDWAHHNERVISTKDKQAYIKFLLKYGEFKQEEAS